MKLFRARVHGGLCTIYSIERRITRGRFKGQWQSWICVTGSPWKARQIARALNKMAGVA